MVLRVLFFGQLREIVGVAEEACLAPDESKLEDLFAIYADRFPRLAEFRASIAASINQEYAPWNARPRAGDEVAFLPPVSGGSPQPFEDIVQIVRAIIRTEQIVATLKAAEDGAVAVFEGIVRNHSRGKTTLYLEYEAYEPMALAEMRKLAREAGERWKIVRIAIAHRVGTVEIGETSVAIAVSSAHRAEAFEACRFAIDRLKEIVPIWKKEYFEGGELWIGCQTSHPPTLEIK
jgi:MoaE-MoaD fusion protein